MLILASLALESRFFLKVHHCMLLGTSITKKNAGAATLSYARGIWLAGRFMHVKDVRFSAREC